jgi:hypothetical protein
MPVLMCWIREFVNHIAQGTKLPESFHALDAFRRIWGVYFDDAFQSSAHLFQVLSDGVHSDMDIANLLSELMCAVDCLVDSVELGVIQR